MKTLADVDHEVRRELLWREDYFYSVSPFLSRSTRSIEPNQYLMIPFDWQNMKQHFDVEWEDQSPRFQEWLNHTNSFVYYSESPYCRSFRIPDTQFKSAPWRAKYIVVFERFSVRAVALPPKELGNSDDFFLVVPDEPEFKNAAMQFKLNYG